MHYRRLIYCFYFTALLCNQLFATESDRLIKRLKPTGSITDKANLLPPAREQKLRNTLGRGLSESEAQADSA